VIRKFLNRLFGRTDPVTYAINAYIEGNASADEMKLVEQMMRDDPALEKDLATQQALLGVLGRIGGIEAHRSFAITPEMVAAAESSRSAVSKLAELFAPQRKLALAPMVVAGFAALTVALLTIGDITGVFEQSGIDDDSFSISASAAQPAAAARAPDSGVTDEDSGAIDEGQDAGAAPTLAAAPPQDLESSDATLEFGDDDEVAKRGELIPEDSEESAVAAQLQEAIEPGPETESITSSGIGSDIGEGAGAGTADGATAGAGDGIELPLWQLQIVLAAIALAAIGAWAGLRRVRGE
jgi:anti-sigma factor RsiW